MSSPFHLSYFDPPEELSRHILATFYFSSDQVDIIDRHPGALGQFVIIPEGEGVAHFANHSDRFSPGAYMFCGFSRSVDIEIKGPWTNIGASLTPLGWAAISGTPARDHLDSVRPAESFLGHQSKEFTDDLIARYHSGEVSGGAACGELAEWWASACNRSRIIMRW